MPPRRQQLERNYDDMVDANALHITEEQASTFGEPREVLKASEAQALREKAGDSDRLRQRLSELQSQLQSQTNALMVQDGTLIVQGFQFSSTGLVAPEEITYENWEQIGELIFRLEGAIQWLIGDWLAYGADLQYGDVKLIAESLHRDEHTFYNYMAVCRSIESSRRRELVSFSHHYEVMGLSLQDQELALDYAEETGISLKKFRQWVRDEFGHAKKRLVRSPQLRFRPIADGLDKYMDRDPSTAKPGEKETALSYAAQMRTWLEAYEKKWGAS